MGTKKIKLSDLLEQYNFYVNELDEFFDEPMTFDEWKAKFQPILTLKNKSIETLYYSLHNYNQEFNDYETIRLWKMNKSNKKLIISELERDLDNNFSVMDELNFHIEDWEDETTYTFEKLETVNN